MWKRCSKICGPIDWVAAMVSGRELQSSKKLQIFGWEKSKYCVTIGLISSAVLQYLKANLSSISRVSESAVHWVRIWCKSSTLQASAHLGESWQIADAWGDQWLQSCWVRYLPDNICAWTVAMTTLAGEDPMVLQIGCGVFRDMNKGLKYCKDDNGAASFQSFISQ